MLLTHDLGRPAFTSGPAGAAGRPMQVSVWYPARAVSGDQVMTVADYLHLQAQEVNLAPLDPERRRAAETAFTNDHLAGRADPAKLATLLATKTGAIRDAPAAEGRFPLILFLHSSPLGESVMSEYLASHGFVVAAVPSKGSFQPAYRLSLPDLETMVADAQFVLATARSLPMVKPGSVVAIGMSNGALGAVKLALRDPDIRGVVSLDGTIGERAAGSALPKDAFYDIARISVPIVHFYNDDNAYLDLTTLRSWDRSERHLARLSKLPHPAFLAYAMFERLLPGTIGPTPVDAAPRFEWICRRTWEFADAVLGGSGSFKDRLAVDTKAIDVGLEHWPAVPAAPASPLPSPAR
jgi:dienelactone hydrolase